MVPRISFESNAWPTLGVELELQLLDPRTMALKSAFAELHGRLPEAVGEWVKPEFMQCYAEVTTGVCRTAADVRADLAAKLAAIERAAAEADALLFWAGTHPFSRWQDQQITPDARYYKLADLLRETVVRPVTFGMHIHVGMPSGDVAVRVMDRFHRHLPLLLALSANSPFWHGRATGYHAHRIEVLEGFPTGGLPPRMGGWDAYLGLVDRMREAGFIESPRELWWDLRPSPENGTLEIRIFDMPPDLDELIALTALTQCLAERLIQEDAENVAEAETHPLIHRQNRWRAARFGRGAEIVEPETLERVPVSELTRRLVDELAPIATTLGCESELDRVRAMVAAPGGSDRQLDLFSQAGDLGAMMRRFRGEDAEAVSPAASPFVSLVTPQPAFRGAMGTITPSL